LREKWGAPVWALDRMVETMEHPERFDYAAMIESYRHGFDAVRVERAFKSGETFSWEGFKLTVDWMPGQTEFALCLSGEIDGRKVAFTGDNIFGYAADPEQTGHEALVARNSAILEEGYLYGAELLRRLKPDLIVGGHSFVIDRPAAMIDRYHQWALDVRAAFQALSTDEDYRYMFDPYWVRAEPYRIKLARGQSSELRLWVRNFRPRPQEHRITLHAPQGIVAEPAVLTGKLDASSRQAFPVRLKAAADAPPGVAIVALDITLDGRRYGEWFDFIVQIE